MGSRYVTGERSGDGLSTLSDVNVGLGRYVLFHHGEVGVGGRSEVRRGSG